MESFFSHPMGMVSYVTRALQIFSAIIVLGITAWAARGTKTLTVIFSLTIAVITIVFAVLSSSISFVLRRQRWHIFPILITDAIISYLWLTSFIFLAQDFNRQSCRISRWNGEVVCSRQYTAEAFSFIAFFASMVTLALEVAYIHHPKTRAVAGDGEISREQAVSENLTNAGLLPPR
ncbi:uncharacterized protein N7483_011018 [Penicillium malachiteum]|uniref:uncharacterized protein n=1 Tax=Penicillium malachiteum TaxID=1324776 RepID=UPI002547CAD9|nr:uncharacterized protein N7483_011018 [Penicillium malachiteum]KAJ5713837.1 hypothetical protein N7483_011018 [Penicillium malachiteum]